MVFEPHPGDEGGAEGEVEESFVGDGQDDEDWREGQKDDDEAVEVVVVWLKTVEEWYGQGCNCDVVTMFSAFESQWFCILKIVQPITWLPNGRPVLACRDATLDRVTIMASMIKPTWIPSRVADRPSSEASLPPVVAERMLFSKRMYNTPTSTIRKPPVSLSKI